MSLQRAVEESLAADRNQTQTVAGGLLLSRRWAKGPARESATLTLVVPGEQGIPSGQHAAVLAACNAARAQQKASL